MADFPLEQDGIEDALSYGVRPPPGGFDISAIRCAGVFERLR
jgi:hypothetical protein